MLLVERQLLLQLGAARQGLRPHRGVHGLQLLVAGLQSLDFFHLFAMDELVIDEYQQQWQQAEQQLLLSFLVPGQRKREGH